MPKWKAFPCLQMAHQNRSFASQDSQPSCSEISYFLSLRMLKREWPQRNSFAIGFSMNTLGFFGPRLFILVASTALMPLQSKTNDFWHDDADDFYSPEHQVSTLLEKNNTWATPAQNPRGWGVGRSCLQKDTSSQSSPVSSAAATEK